MKEIMHMSTLQPAEMDAYVKVNNCPFAPLFVGCKITVHCFRLTFCHILQSKLEASQCTPTIALFYSNFRIHTSLNFKIQQLQQTLDTLTACRARLEFPDSESRLRAFTVHKDLFFRHFHGRTVLI